jgi:hypothetical protein
MEFQTLTDFLSPVEGHETFDYILYGLFFMGMLTLTFMGKGSTQMDTIFVTLAVFMILLDKLYIAGFIFEPAAAQVDAEITSEQRVAVHIDHFFTYAMRVMIFVLPLVVAGNTKNNRTRVIAGLFAMFAFAYSFGRWYFEIRANAEDELGMTSPIDGAVAAGGLALVVIGEIIARLRNQRQKHYISTSTTE